MLGRSLQTASAAHSCRSPVGLALQCSFPKADIGEVAQHLDWPDGDSADKDEAALAALVLIANGVRPLMPSAF